MGPSLQDCLDALDDDDDGHGHVHESGELHILERTSLTFLAQNCILNQAPNLTRFKVSGSLPHLQVNVSRCLAPLASLLAVKLTPLPSLSFPALGSQVQKLDEDD
jgi:hypothetical protein